MCARNAKSECILIKLRALDLESICERITKFHENILYDSRVINLQILTTKYLCFQYSVAYCSHLSGNARICSPLQLVLHISRNVNLICLLWIHLYLLSAHIFYLNI